MKHELKIWPNYFARVADSSKTFEVRFNDRGFQKGDTVILKEFDPTQILQNHRYTGRQLTFLIGYVFPIEDTNTVVFSLLKLEEPNAH